MKRSKNFFKFEEKPNRDKLWESVLIQPIGEDSINVKNEEYDLTPNIQKTFTNTKLTTKSLKNYEKGTVFDIPNNIGFYDIKHAKGFAKTILKTINPLLPAIENIEDSYEEISAYDWEGRGIGKIITPSNIIDIYTRLEVLLGNKTTWSYQHSYRS